VCVPSVTVRFNHFALMYHYGEVLAHGAVTTLLLPDIALHKSTEFSGSKSVVSTFANFKAID
jgi:hypothetical protein